MKETIRLVHTNDLHSHFEHWPKMRRWIQTRRKESQANHINMYAVDLGDFCDRSHPLTEATDGRANVQLMNEIGYTGVTIGNNEGIGNSHDQLETLYIGGDFDVVLANLKDRHKEEYPKWLTPYKIETTLEGTKIAFIGLTAPFPLTYEPNGWDILNPIEVLNTLVPKLKEQADVIVLLSHLGIKREIEIAQQFKDIDVILGSHTHQLFTEGKWVNQTLLAAAGKYGEYIGEVTLVCDTHQLVEKKASVYAVDQMEAKERDSSEVEEYINRGKALLTNQVIGYLPATFSPVQSSSALSYTELGLLAVKEYAGVEAAVLNSGLFLSSLSKGEVTKEALHRTIPHPMHIMKVTFTGKELDRFIREMEKNRLYLEKFPMVGMGFRGKIFGHLMYSGLSYHAETKQTYYLDQPIQFEKSYTIATVDHYLFIPFFPTIELAGQVEMLFPEFLRNVVEQFITEHYSYPQKIAIMNRKD